MELYSAREREEGHALSARSVEMGGLVSRVNHVMENEQELARRQLERNGVEVHWARASLVRAARRAAGARSAGGRPARRGARRARPHRHRLHRHPQPGDPLRRRVRADQRRRAGARARAAIARGGRRRRDRDRVREHLRRARGARRADRQGPDPASLRRRRDRRRAHLPAAPPPRDDAPRRGSVPGRDRGARRRDARAPRPRLREADHHRAGALQYRALRGDGWPRARGARHRARPSGAARRRRVLPDRRAAYLRGRRRDRLPRARLHVDGFRGGSPRPTPSAARSTRSRTSCHTGSTRCRRSRWSDAPRPS